mmetsp:Transcript_87018/g.198626  ORF Transcript_87018/g.198626 Transcript_87018/m.198626 type:complete len:223 (+) Transcript_87018:2-670(+)
MAEAAVKRVRSYRRRHASPAPAAKDIVLVQTPRASPLSTVAVSRSSTPRRAAPRSPRKSEAVPSVGTASTAVSSTPTTPPSDLSAVMCPSPRRRREAGEQVEEPQGARSTGGYARRHTPRRSRPESTTPGRRRPGSAPTTPRQVCRPPAAPEPTIDDLLKQQRALQRSWRRTEALYVSPHVGFSCISAAGTKFQQYWPADKPKEGTAPVRAVGPFAFSKCAP